MAPWQWIPKISLPMVFISKSKTIVKRTILENRANKAGFLENSTLNRKYILWIMGIRNQCINSSPFLLLMHYSETHWSRRSSWRCAVKPNRQLYLLISCGQLGSLLFYICSLSFSVSLFFYPSLLLPWLCSFQSST